MAHIGRRAPGEYDFIAAGIPIAIIRTVASAGGTSHPSKKAKVAGAILAPKHQSFTGQYIYPGRTSVSPLMLQQHASNVAYRTLEPRRFTF
jgi:hypothetical protein